MMIDGLCSSVGPVYADYMRRILPVWAATLDSVTVVTVPGDPVVAVCHGQPRVRVVETDVFHRHGAAFNKGAALTLAYATMDPIDAVLHFDADILPPPDWRATAEREFRAGCIHGAVRRDEAGNKITDLGDWPYGYFQLWHSADAAAQFWPLFEVWHASAGGYDMEFLEHWSRRQRVALSFDVTHFGEVRSNWFGVGLPEAEQAESLRRMAQVHRVGLRETRMRTRDPKNRLAVPPFALRFAVTDRNCPPEHARALTRACMTDDPFLVELAARETPAAARAAKQVRQRPLGSKVSVQEVRQMVVDAYRARHGREPL